MKISVQILKLSVIFLLLGFQPANSQVDNQSSLTIKEIMAKNYIGQAPKGIQWSQDSKHLFFRWKKSDAVSDSAYQITPGDLKPVRVDASVIRDNQPVRGIFSSDRRLQLLSDKNGLSLIKLKKKDTTRFDKESLA